MRKQYTVHYNKSGEIACEGTFYSKSEAFDALQEFITDMNENLNLVEILKDCPKGTKLYTPISGEVYLNRVYCNNDDYPIGVSCDISGNGIELSFSKDGRYYTECEDGECILFPSREQRDWSKFKPKEKKFDPKTLKPFDKVLVRDTNSKPWRCSLFSHIETDLHLFPYATCGGYYSFCIPFNDDTKHLVGTTEEAPEFYRYWED